MKSRQKSNVARLKATIAQESPDIDVQIGSIEELVGAPSMDEADFKVATADSDLRVAFHLRLTSACVFTSLTMANFHFVNMCQCLIEDTIHTDSKIKAMERSLTVGARSEKNEKECQREGLEVISQDFAYCGERCDCCCVLWCGL